MSDGLRRIFLLLYAAWPQEVPADGGEVSRAPDTVIERHQPIPTNEADDEAALGE